MRNIRFFLHIFFVILVGVFVVIQPSPIKNQTISARETAKVLPMNIHLKTIFTGISRNLLRQEKKQKKVIADYGESAPGINAIFYA